MRGVAEIKFDSERQMAKLSMHMFIRKNRGNLDDNLKYKKKKKKKVKFEKSKNGLFLPW